jgi:hypothetical protein
MYQYPEHWTGTFVWDLGQCSHLHMGSLVGEIIVDEGARDLGAALQVNTTLTELK